MHAFGEQSPDFRRRVSETHTLRAQTYRHRQRHQPKQGLSGERGGGSTAWQQVTPSSFPHYAAHGGRVMEPLERLSSRSQDDALQQSGGAAARPQRRAPKRASSGGGNEDDDPDFK